MILIKLTPQKSHLQRIWGFPCQQRVDEPIHSKLPQDGQPVKLVPKRCKKINYVINNGTKII